VHFTANEDEKDKLRDFVSPQGQDDLYSYCHRVRRTTFEVLKDFRDVKIPLDYIMDLFPLIMPRSFSIASSSLTGVQEQPALAGNGVAENVERALECKVDLCVAIVHYKTKLWKWRTGVCTRWLKDLPSTEEVASETLTVGKEVTAPRAPAQFSIRIQRGTLKLPKDPNVPLICIGPGKSSPVFVS